MKSLRVLFVVAHCGAEHCLLCHVTTREAAEHGATRMRGISSPEWEDVVQSSDASIPGVPGKPGLGRSSNGLRKGQGLVAWVGVGRCDTERALALFGHQSIHASTPVIHVFFFFLPPTALEA